MAGRDEDYEPQAKQPRVSSTGNCDTSSVIVNVSAGPSKVKKEERPPQTTENYYALYFMPDDVPLLNSYVSTTFIAALHALYSDELVSITEVHLFYLKFLFTLLVYNGEKNCCKSQTTINMYWMSYG